MPTLLKPELAVPCCPPRVGGAIVARPRVAGADIGNAGLPGPVLPHPELEMLALASAHDWVAHQRRWGGDAVEVR